MQTRQTEVRASINQDPFPGNRSAQEARLANYVEPILPVMIKQLFDESERQRQALTQIFNLVECIKTRPEIKENNYPILPEVTGEMDLISRLDILYQHSQRNCNVSELIAEHLKSLV